MTRIEVDDSFGSRTYDITAKRYTYDKLVSKGGFDRAPWRFLFEGSAWSD
jgi:hypothetical protein